MKTTVADVMTDRVVAAREGAGFKEIIQVMRGHRLSALPVVDAHNRVLGVVSEADLLIKEALLVKRAGPASRHASRFWLRAAVKRKAAAAVAQDLMTRPAMTIGPDATLAEAASRMCERRVKRLPVTDEAGRLIGIVSRIDVLSVFSRAEADIRDEIVSELILSKFSLDPEYFEVTVRSGIVTITGQADSREAAVQLLDAIQHVEAVVDVRDRISYPDKVQAGSPAPPLITARA